ncbi:integrase family protein [Yersinia frederiksenii]|nr:integrase family protein [Yersinia frederiksenii]
MLTDTKLKNLKPREKLYKVTDRDGLYVAVATGGTVSFRYDYRINGRRETLTIGRYGRDGISLAEARNELNEAKKLVELGQSPAALKRDGKNKVRNAIRFRDFTVAWLKAAKFVDSTRNLKQSIINRDIEPVFGNRLMHEITTADVRSHCDKVMRERSAPSTALQIREIISSVYQYAIDRGHDVKNPAVTIKASSIATFEPRERALTEEEIGVFFRATQKTSGTPIIKLAVKLILLTLVRKSELTNAVWGEIDFVNKIWTIPAERMKSSRAHNIYLSDQSIEILTTLKMVASGSDYVLPSRYHFDRPISGAALNNAITVTVNYINNNGGEFAHCTVHDMRRTASTILHEHGFNSDWIEKCLAHEQKGTRAVYNKAEYAEQRREMLQQWANMIDGWIAGSGK